MKMSARPPPPPLEKILGALLVPNIRTVLTEFNKWRELAIFIPSTMIMFEARDLFRRRLSAEGAKPESNNRWKSELGHVCIMWVGGWVVMYGIWNYLANQGT